MSTRSIVKGQLDNTNPRTIEPAGPKLVRPAGKSVVGPDGYVWTGWMAAYGVYGGGLSRVNVGTLEMTSWYDPVPEQAVVGTASDADYLYFITSGSANGLATREVEPHFAVWSCDGRITWQRAFDLGSELRSIAAAGGLVLLSVDRRLEIFSPADLAFERTVDLPAPCVYLASLPDGRAAAFTEDHLWLLNPGSGVLEDGGPMPGRVGSLACTPDGQLYIAVGNQLYRLEI